MPSPKRSIFSTAFLILGILFIATNLRSPVTGIGVVLDQIIESLQLNASQAGLLTTLPLIAFAIASPLATILARRHGLETSLFIALLLIGLGLCSRVIDSTLILYVGTAVIGIGIAIGNVLLPSLVKRDFPHKAAVMTSSYVLAMGIFSGSYSALLIPLADYKDMGWQLALACYGLITLISILIWLPQLKLQDKRSKDIQQPKQGKIWNHALAWYITLLLGLNSFFTYVMITWLPSILVEGGLDPEEAGVLHGMFQLASASPGIVLIPLLATLKDQRFLTLILALIACFCSLGLLYLPSYSFIWSTSLGFSSGAVYILGISFISLRTHDSNQAVSLSGMSQCIGYLLAATGPMIAGLMYSSFENWSSVLWLCAIASLFCAVFGYLSGRNIVLHRDA